MAAAISAAFSNGVVTVTGTGFVADARVTLSLSFISTVAKARSHTEIHHVSADGTGVLIGKTGSAGAAIDVPYTSGAVVVRALSPTTGAQLAITGSVAV